MSEAVRLEIVLAPEALEALVEEVRRRVLAELADGAGRGRWLTGAAAAAGYLGCSAKRVYNRLPEIPHVREGGRLLFNTADLDGWLRSGRVP